MLAIAVDLGHHVSTTHKFTQEFVLGCQRRRETVSHTFINVEYAITALRSIIQPRQQVNISHRGLESLS